MRLKFTILLLTAGTLAACASVTSETTETIVVENKPYELRTRTIESSSGSYQQSSVRVNSNYFPCLRDSPGDCERAVKRGLSRFDRGGGR